MDELTNEQKVYEFKEGNDVVKIKPCRLCSGKPEFYFFDTWNLENWYYLGCKKCNIGDCISWTYDKLVERWNDWSIDIENWKKNVNNCD